MANNATQARVVVGLDFGTTFSGFAYAHKSDPENIHTFYEWPMHLKGGGKPYCKTQTSLYYVPAAASNNNNKSNKRGSSSSSSSGSDVPKYELKEWAWPAQVMYLEDLQAKKKSPGNVNGDLEFLLPSASRRYGAEAAAVPTGSDAGYFVRRFKLHLAGSQDGDDDDDDDNPKSSSKNGKKQQQPLRRKGVLRRMVARVVGAFTAVRPSASSSSGSNSKGVTPALELVDPDPVAVEKKQALEAFKAAGWVQPQSQSDPKAAKPAAGPYAYGVFNDLPPGMTVERAISDYLARLADFAVEHLQATYGKHLSKREVQWCVTVPAIWDDWAKQRMRQCAQRAGMVTGPDCPRELEHAASPHQLIVVLESEAASVYCARRSKQLELNKGDQFLVADVGGGTVDIVVHTKDSAGPDGLRLRETRQSAGGLCGGTYVDKNFVNHMADRVPVFVDFISQHPAAITTLLRRWEEVKCTFDGSPAWTSTGLELPRRLSAAWEAHDAKYTNKDKVTCFNYDEVELNALDMRAIFDPVVDQILELVRQQMTEEIKVLMLVGGFSASPYLARRVREAFGKRVQDIVNPPDPGSAICQGAVTLGLFPEIVMARVSRKTYGINQYVPYKAHHPKSALVTVEGVSYCSTAFTTYVKRGDQVEFDQQVTRANFPVRKGQRSLTIQIYSTEDRCPMYVTDPGVRLEGSFVIDISDDPEGRDMQREVHVSMFFGKSCIQLNAKRINFGNRDEVVEMHDTLGFEFVAGMQGDL